MSGMMAGGGATAAMVSARVTPRMSARRGGCAPKPDGDREDGEDRGDARHHVNRPDWLSPRVTVRGTPAVPTLGRIAVGSPPSQPLIVSAYTER